MCTSVEDVCVDCTASWPQFKDWFSNPLTGAVETGQEVSRQLVERLHGVLRPFLLRWARLKKGLSFVSVLRSWLLGSGFRVMPRRSKPCAEQHAHGAACQPAVNTVCSCFTRPDSKHRQGNQARCAVLCRARTAGGSSPRWRSRCLPSTSTC